MLSGMEARHTVASTLLFLGSIACPGSASCSAPVASPLSRPPVQTYRPEAIGASVTIVQLTPIDSRQLQAPKAPREARAQPFTRTVRQIGSAETPDAKPVAYIVAEFQ